MILWLQSLLNIGPVRAWLILTLALCTGAGFACWLVVSEVRGMVADTAATARAERDAVWRAELEASNAKAESARAAQAVAMSRADAQAAAEIARLQTTLTELEISNAALPGGGNCGLGADRVRLLPR